VSSIKKAMREMSFFRFRANITLDRNLFEELSERSASLSFSIVYIQALLASSYDKLCAA
jgi:hypothetical protein